MSSLAPASKVILFKTMQVIPAVVIAAKRKTVIMRFVLFWGLPASLFIFIKFSEKHNYKRNCRKKAHEI